MDIFRYEILVWCSLNGSRIHYCISWIRSRVDRTLDSLNFWNSVFTSGDVRAPSQGCLSHLLATSSTTEVITDAHDTCKTEDRRPWRCLLCGCIQEWHDRMSETICMAPWLTIACRLHTKAGREGIGVQFIVFLRNVALCNRHAGQPWRGNDRSHVKFGHRSLIFFQAAHIEVSTNIYSRRSLF